MTTTMTKGNAIRYYRKYTGTDRYFIGFQRKGFLWVADESELMPRWLTIRKPTGNHKEKLQMDLKAKHKDQLIKKGAKPVMTSEEFEEMAKAMAKGQTNKGWTLEKIIFDMFEQSEDWDRDNTSFEDCGDINIDGVEYQIKYENAQIVVIQTLRDIQKRKKMEKRITNW